MHLASIDQIRAPYAHVYLSPHLDDAALSCGGAIAARANAGDRVLVVTLCTAVPPEDAPLGPLAREFHGDWNLPHDQAVTARLHEDALAMQRLGADYLWAGMLDSIYRMPDAYDTREKLFGTPDPDDPLLPELRRFLAALQERLPQATLYAPLGVGFHVDHQITYTAALECAGGGVAFYEDIYYVLEPGELERRLAALGERFVPSTINIDATLSRKIGAIDAYASQIEELFGGSEQMARAITDYAEGLRPEIGTYGERVWLRAASDMV